MSMQELLLMIYCANLNAIVMHTILYLLKDFVRCYDAILCSIRGLTEKCLLIYHFVKFFQESMVAEEVY